MKPFRRLDLLKVYVLLVFLSPSTCQGAVSGGLHNTASETVAVTSSESSTCSSSSPLRSTPIWKDRMMQRIGAKVMGESALIDKETGRIFWEGGSTSTVAASISPLLTSKWGMTKRLKSILVSIALWTCILSIISTHLKQQLKDHKPLSWPMLTFIIITRWTIYQVPHLDTWFIITVVLVYFLESYFCNTQRYLANAISEQARLEDLMERLRQEQPHVLWKVRCFHYERRIWANIPLLPQLLFRRVFPEIRVDAETSSASLSKQDQQSLSPSLFTKKVVTHEAETTYQYKTCLDTTVVGLWERANTIHPPPFTKIVLTKILSLGNKKACQDYFAQQADFVSTQGRSDEYAEFSTNIIIPGYKPKVLAIRASSSVNGTAARLRIYWFFTMLGLTVPYRIWLARNCDEVRVTVAKETFAELPKKSKESSGSGWFGSRKKAVAAATAVTSTKDQNPTFRQVMQELAQVYETEQKSKTATGTDIPPTQDERDTAALLQDIKEASEAVALVDAVDSSNSDIATPGEDKQSSSTTVNSSSGQQDLSMEEPRGNVEAKTFTKQPHHSNMNPKADDKLNQHASDEIPLSRETEDSQSVSDEDLVSENSTNLSIEKQVSLEEDSP